MAPAWATNWMWGLLLIAVTLVIHALGLVMIGQALGLERHFEVLRMPRGSGPPARFQSRAT